MTEKKPLCRVHMATDDRTWCTLPATYAVQPTCACDRLYVTCGRHLSTTINTMTARTCQHEGRNAARVTALKSV